MTEYKSYRFIDGKAKWIIADENGKIINKEPSKELLKYIEKDTAEDRKGEKKIKYQSHIDIKHDEIVKQELVRLKSTIENLRKNDIILSNKLKELRGETVEQESLRLKNVAKNLRKDNIILSDKLKDLKIKNKNLSLENIVMSEEIGMLRQTIYTLTRENIKLNKNTVKCAKCGKNILLCKKDYHHIIPREFDGPDDDYNRMPLCSECHNYVEEKTYEWIRSNKPKTIDILKSLIINDGFDDIE